MGRCILIASDAWEPQVNGVVRTLRNTRRTLESLGHQVTVLSPSNFPHFPCPIYPEVPLSLPYLGRMGRLIESANPDHIHIATEGPVGLMVRSYCLNERLAFTTSFHTMFPDYLKTHARIPPRITWRYLRWFHEPSAQVLAPTPSVIELLRAQGFSRVTRWSRGIDTARWKPRTSLRPVRQRPLLLYVGRVSKEKNIAAFLGLPNEGERYVVGDGPMRATLERSASDARFFGYVDDERLSQIYAEADVFVFPSLTDTFGNVILEALASGVPVAAYPAPGPKDLITSAEYGALDKDLSQAVDRALSLGDREKCRAYAASFTWEECTAQFFKALVPVGTSSHHS